MFTYIIKYNPTKVNGCAGFYTHFYKSFRVVSIYFVTNIKKPFTLVAITL